MKRFFLRVAWRVGIVILALAIGLPNAVAQEPYLVKDINPGSSDADINSRDAELGNLYLFSADDGVNGSQLWISDGSADGTFLLDIPDPGGEFTEFEGGSAELNGFLYFAANDGTNGVELWRSDGTPEGTDLFLDIDNTDPGLGSDPERFERLGDILLFAADDGVHGTELWKTDGTIPGTMMVKDIDPTGDNSSSPEGLNQIGDLVFFSAGDGTNGTELWRTDGTDGGTFMVQDIRSGPVGSDIGRIRKIGDTAIFGANDGVDGKEIWMSDGTLNGASQILDINTGVGVGSNPLELATVGDLVFFIADDGTGDGQELWRTDGTPGGTVQVEDIRPGGDGSEIDGIRALGDLALLLAQASAGDRELWVSGGNPDGSDTFEITINPGGSAEVLINGSVELGGKVYFSATDGTNGFELWCTDGTVEGTMLVRDLDPAGNSFALPLRSVGGRLFFAADEDNGLGGELYALTGNLPHLANISTRGQVGTGDNVMIAGIIIEGGRKRVLIRVNGPSLDIHGVPNTLNDPFLRIFDGQTEIATNDDWRDAQETEIEASGLQPGFDVESAVILELDPGAYTAIVSGVGNTTGNAIVEVFELD